MHNGEGCTGEGDGVMVTVCVITHVDPSEGDEVVLVLHVKDLFLIERLA